MKKGKGFDKDVAELVTQEYPISNGRKLGIAFKVVVSMTIIGGKADKCCTFVQNFFLEVPLWI